MTTALTTSAFDQDTDEVWLVLVTIAVLDLAVRIKFRTPYFRNGLFTLLISLKMYALLVLWVYYLVLDWLRQKKVDALPSI